LPSLSLAEVARAGALAVTEALSLVIRGEDMRKYLSGGIRDENRQSAVRRREKRQRAEDVADPKSGDAW
jgi:hypothetical protein